MVFIAATISSILVALACANASLARELWIGGDTLPLFRMLTIPFGLTVGALNAALHPKRAAFAVHSVATLTVVILYVAISSFLFGASWIAWEMQAFSCWLAGAASGTLVAYAVRRRLSLSYAMGAVLLVTALAVFATRPMFNLISKDQDLTLLLMFHIASEEPLTLENAIHRDVSNLGEEALMNMAEAHLPALQAAGLSGRLLVLSGSRFGQGNTAHALLVLNAPIRTQHSLPQPDNDTIIYIQRDQQWNVSPAGVPLLRRSFELFPAAMQGKLGFVTFTQANGTGVIFPIMKPASATEPMPE